MAALGRDARVGMAGFGRFGHLAVRASGPARAALFVQAFDPYSMPDLRVYAGHVVSVAWRSWQSMAVQSISILGIGHILWHRRAPRRFFPLRANPFDAG